MSGEKEMEMLTEIFRKFDKYKDMITDKWQDCNVCMKKDIALAILVVALLWCIL
jgi:hypothetical protein